MPETSPEYDTFISHASVNGNAAMQLAEALERTGLRCWIAPRDIRPGREYAGEIIHGIRHSRTLILLLSEAANESPFVRREVERAVHHRKSVFPVRLESISPSQSLELFISSTHWIDLASQSIEAIAQRLSGEIKAQSVNDSRIEKTDNPQQSPAPASTNSEPSATSIPAERTHTIAFNNTHELPRDFGKFRLIRLIAEGMALVYEAEQKEPARKVALKIPRGGLLLTREARQRFLREVSLTAGIDHAGIVPVFEAGEVENTPFYTMPLIEGIRFDQFIKEQQLDFNAIIKQFAQLCDVVGALHANNLVHRDLKPANILVDNHHNVRLLDFGLAKVGRGISDLSLTPSVMGSLEYMAPEQAGARTGSIGPQTDVYAIGVMLYTALTGEKPLGSVSEVSDMLHRILEKSPRPPREISPEVSTELNALILSCLHKDPLQRPANAMLLSQRLSATLGTPENHNKKNSKSVLLLALMGVAIASACYLLWPDSDADSSKAQPVAPAETLPANGSAVTVDKAAVALEHRILTPSTKASTTGITPDTAPEIPPVLWSAYSQLKKELREDFSRRNQAALLIYATPQENSNVHISIKQASKELSQVLSPGQCLEIYLTAGQETRITINGKESFRRFSRSDVLYLQP